MFKNDEATSLREAASIVLAHLISEREEVIRIGLVDIAVDNRLCWKFLLLYVTDPEVVTTYIKDLKERGQHRGVPGIDFDGCARYLLTPWLDHDDMQEWLMEHYTDYFGEVTTVDGKAMNPFAWASQLADIELVIVPGISMNVDGTIFGYADINEGPRGRVGALVRKIYNAARDGEDVQTIVGPRKGVRLFNPHPDVMNFEV